MAVLAGGGAPGWADVPELLPLPSLAAVPSLDDPEISPDGRTIATQFRKGGQAFLVLHDIFGAKAGEPATRSLPLPPKATVNWTRWLNDQYLLVSVRKFMRMFHDDVPYDRLYTVDRATRRIAAVGPQRGGQVGDDIIYWAPDGSFLVLNFAPALFSPPAAIRVDLPSNKITTVEPAHFNISNWFTNSRGEVVAGIGPLRGDRLQFIFRPTPDDKFQTLLKLSSKDEDDGTEPLYLAQVDADTQKGYVLSRRGGDRWGLYEFDFRSGTYGDALFKSDVADINDLYFDRAGKLQWVSYIDDRWHMQWFTAADSEFYAALEKAVPHMVARVVSSSADNRIRIVRTDAPTNPGTFFVYSADTGTMKRLGGVSDALVGKPLATTEYVTYKARDGLDIHAYLTRPVGRAPEDLPLVVMPHGGPFYRDQWQYDFLVQYLANRGYTVLQPNFRGSTGYGKTFQQAGYGQLGKAMQDDLDDGVAWLAAAGEIDPERVCMVGWSYGGFAAQVAAFRNPEIYRCAVSIAGISDLPAMIRYDYRFMYWTNWRKWSSRYRGEADSRSLGEVSALRQVKDIRIPLLLIHGDDDNIVPVSQSERLAEALRKAKKQFEFISIADADHSLSEEPQRLQLLTALDRFLGKNNPTDVLSVK